MSDTELAGVVRSINRFAVLADRLKAKCGWEQMTPVAVLREWPEFVDEYRAALAKVEVPDA